MPRVLILMMALAFALSGLAQVRVLVIDESQTLEESLRLLAQGPFIWFCSPWPEDVLPEELRWALAKLREALTQAFASLRVPRGPGDDLYPLLLTVVFASRGYLGGR